MSELRVATVLFTDLVGSTELSTQVGPVEADALRQTHFALLRGAVVSNGGIEVKNLGDGLMVAFSTSSGALACAVAMQQALERHNRGASHVLSVRIGLSHGEVTEEEGDFFGDAVVEAARLCTESAGGQILATQLVQLTSGRRASQDFGPARDVTLKGFDEPVLVVEVLWAPAEGQGRADTAPLPARCELAPEVGFIGRSTERSVLTDAFKEVRLIPR
ncbi:MAG TPA: adenylate/guanylate cyclase domain-containing protein [Acidimicrobiales bacterium]|jgi:class 3 adenylate cyclase